jgi:hypothetical protein
MAEFRPHFVTSQPLGTQQRPDHGVGLATYVAPQAIGHPYPAPQLQLPHATPSQQSAPLYQPGHVSQSGPVAESASRLAANPLNHSNQARSAEMFSQNFQRDDQPASPSQWRPQTSSNSFQPGPYPSAPDYHRQSTTLEDLMFRLQIAEEDTRLANEATRLANETAQLANQKALRAEQRIQKLEKQCKMQSKIIDDLVRTQPLKQTNSASNSNNEIEPALSSTFTRTDTDHSTESYLSGISERDPHTLPTVEGFNADLASIQAQVPRQESSQGFQYVQPELDLAIPRATQGMPSVDSGYESIPRFVNPSDTLKSPVDSDTTFSHT